MSSCPPSRDFTLNIGASRLAALPSALHPALVFPGTNARLKEEEETLLWRLELPAVGAGIVKLYRRRGDWNGIRGRVLSFRVQREFVGLCVLADGGVPCSVPLLWGWGRALEHGQFELLVTREITDAVNLKDYFAAGSPALRSEDFLPLFDALRSMHECGVYHGALWPKNILLTRAVDGVCQFHVIDLARAVRFPGSILGTAMARYDLLSLLYSLARANVDCDAEALLRRHGYQPAEARQIAEQARRYRSSRHLRNRLALTFQLRAAFAGRLRTGN